MDRYELWKRIDVCERRQIAQLGRHATLRSLEQRSREELLQILLQRRFLSLAFSPLYEVALDAMIDPEARECVREILRAEYQRPGQPTHREDLVCDLLVLGATREQILRSAPSPSTLQIVSGLFSALQYRGEGSAVFEVKALAFLRMAGEILVATEYRCLWPRLRHFGLAGAGDQGGTRSVFFYPHMCHDSPTMCMGDATNPLAVMTHSDRFTERLRALLARGTGIHLRCCLEANACAYDLKYAFYDQFSG